MNMQVGCSYKSVVKKKKYGKEIKRRNGKREEEKNKKEKKERKKKRLKKEMEHEIQSFYFIYYYYYYLRIRCCAISPFQLPRESFKLSLSLSLSPPPPPSPYTWFLLFFCPLSLPAPLIDSTLTHSLPSMQFRVLLSIRHNRYFINEQ